jgi:hypothetical protein
MGRGGKYGDAFAHLVHQVLSATLEYGGVHRHGVAISEMVS